MEATNRSSLKVLITGAGGQLGRCLIDELPNGWLAVGTDRDTLDITDSKGVYEFIREGGFDLCINCAAYTAVDRAESDTSAAYAVNEQGALHIARACAANECKLVHLSTDYVYHAMRAQVLTEESDLNPQSVYAASKLAGEKAVIQALPSALVIRTSWVFSEYGHNFFLTMLRLSRSGVVPNVVDDQKGSPTYARDLAKAIWSITSLPEWNAGTYNLCNDGNTTWHEFACEIFRLDGHTELPRPIPTSDYPTPATRPPYSVMSTQKAKDTFGVAMRNWRDAVKDCYSRTPTGPSVDN